MRKFALFFAFFFSIYNVFSQNEYYILGNDTVNKIYYNEVLSSKSDKFFKSIKYKTNDKTSIRLIERSRRGYLNFQQYFLIKKNLTEYSKKEIIDSLPIIISYFHEFDEKAKRKRDFKIIQNWVTKSKKQPEFKDLKINYYKIYDKNSFIKNHSKLINEDDWFEDHKSILKKLFFPYKIEYSSFLIILPNGEYSVYYGSYPFDLIIKNLKYWNYFDEYLKRGVFINQKWFHFID